MLSSVLLANPSLLLLRLQVAELGVVGGAGMRIYFTMLITLSMLFFVQGFLAIPGLCLCDRHHDYGHGRIVMIKRICGLFGLMI